MWHRFIIILIACFSIGIRWAGAVTYKGVDFPDGEKSFADKVVSYDPYVYMDVPTEEARHPERALGPPDSTGSDWKFVTLGDGGSIIFQFTDNSLTGSGDSALDLWIFEVGSDVEDTFVYISKDGTTWHSVGKVYGSTAGIDIDGFGWGVTDFFSFVKLVDDPDEGHQASDWWRDITVGADIDAVGAISSAPPVGTPVPEPGTLFLLGGGITVLAGWRRRRTI